MQVGPQSWAAVCLEPPTRSMKSSGTIAVGMTDRGLC